MKHLQKTKNISINELNYIKDRSLSLTPISIEEDKEFVDVLYKENDFTYYQDGEDFFKYFDFDFLPQGQTLEFAQINSQINFHFRKSQFELKNYSRFTDYLRNDKSKTINKILPVKRIGMVCEGIGVGSMFQIVNSIHYSSGFVSKVSNMIREKPAISLIYCNSLVEEICFADDFYDYSRKGKIAFFPIVKYPTENFKYGIGGLSKSHISDYLPDPRDKESLVLISGNKDFCKESLSLLEAEGYQEGENILIYNHCL